VATLRPGTDETANDVTGAGGRTALAPATVTFLVADVSPVSPSVDVAETAHRCASAHGGWTEDAGEPSAVVAVFTRAADALGAALDLQLALPARIGIHTGDAEIEAGRYAGSSLVHAARLRDLAHRGQVLMSGATAGVAGDRVPDGASLIDLGTHWIKELQRKQWVYQLAHEALPTAFPPLGSMVSVPNNLPAPRSSFVGRRTELAELAALLANAPMLTLVGAGGCGKTRLAMELASERADHFTDGIWWVGLATVPAGDDVTGPAMTALSIDDTRGSTPIDRLAAHLSHCRALLVLDNCEHVRASCAQLTDQLLEACEDLTVITTSREPIGAARESVWRVPPLAHPGLEGDTALASLDSFDATRLFLGRAVEARPNFRVTNDNAPAIAEICARLDGIPLAIELAAARVRVLTPDRILAGLDDRFRLLTAVVPADDPRQRTLRASVEWSHDLLTPSERTVLRRLSVFAGGFTLDAAERVCSDETLDQIDVLDLVSQLVDKSLVALDDTHEERYRMLETIRRFAEEQLLEVGEMPAVRDRHLSFFEQYAEQHATDLARTADPSLLDRFDADRDNLSAAIGWALDTSAADRALALCVHLVFAWVLRGRYWDGQAWLRRALATAEHGIHPARARALQALAQVSLVAMDVENAFGYSHAQEAVSIAQQLDDDVILTMSQWVVTFIEAAMAPAVARTRFAESVDALRKAAEPWGLAWGLMSIGYLTSFFWDRHDEARATFAELRSVATKTGNRYFLAWCTAAEGIAEVRQGRYRDGRAHLEPALSFAREIGEPILEMATTMVLGDLEIAEGHHDAAQRLIAESRDRLARSGRGRLEAVELRLADSFRAQGDVESARQACVALAPQLDGFPIPYFATQLHLVQATIAVDEGDADEADAHLGPALEIARTLDNPWLTASVLSQLGWARRLADETTKAEDSLHQALAIQMQHEFRPDAIASLEAIAGLAIAGESWAEGVRLAAAAAIVRAEIGCVRAAGFERRYQVDVAAAQRALGDEMFSEAWAEGTLLSLEQAVAYASRARGERRRPSSGWASLTPVELEVVRHASQGLTNPQIAERMFITRATVKTHLSHVYAKLGVTNRAELASQAARRGI
jgi:predicted ATPase/DNA-binding CsgD family transcriptional regulator